MSEFAGIIGKRLYKVSWSVKDGEPVVVLMFTDMTICTVIMHAEKLELMTIPAMATTGVEILEIPASDNSFESGSATFADNPEARQFNQDLYSLFIRLWDKAGTLEYDKKEWNRFDSMMCELGMRRDR